MEQMTYELQYCHYYIQFTWLKCNMAKGLSTNFAGLYRPPLKAQSKNYPRVLTYIETHFISGFFASVVFFFNRFLKSMYSLYKH